MAQQIQVRRDISSNWTDANPILASGELGLEIDTNKLKAGDGVTAWNSLDYLVSSSVSDVAAALDDGSRGAVVFYYDEQDNVIFANIDGGTI